MPERRERPKSGDPEVPSPREQRGQLKGYETRGVGTDQNYEFPKPSRPDTPSEPSKSPPDKS